MLAPWLGFVDPLVSRERLDAGRPDRLGSGEYADDYLEVKRVGAATGADRTPYQTETAQFFNDNIAVLIQDAVLGRLEQHPRSLRATTRLFATMHGAMTDSIITAWRQKYDAGFCGRSRPSTAPTPTATRPPCPNRPGHR